MYNSKIRDVLAITKEDDLLSELGRFEDALTEELRPVQSLLAKDVRTTDVASIEDHMTNVERYRERICRFHGLALCFLDHCKSDHFKLIRVKGVTEFDREAYQKRLTAGFKGLEAYLANLIDCIDSRVNDCKILLRLGEDGTSFGGRRR
jgi:hypothetical protein